MDPEKLVKKINNVHSIVQEVEASSLNNAMTEDEYQYIYSALEDVREYLSKGEQ